MHQNEALWDEEDEETQQTAAVSALLIPEWNGNEPAKQQVWNWPQSPFCFVFVFSFFRLDLLPSVTYNWMFGIHLYVGTSRLCSQRTLREHRLLRKHE